MAVEIPPARPAASTLPPAVAPGPRRRWVLLARVAASAALLAWVLTHADIRQVGAVFRRADPGLVALLLVVFPVGYVLASMRWRVLLASLGHRLPLRYLMTSWLVAAFFRQLLPSTIGGDAIRVWDSWRAGVGRGQAVSVILVERLVGMLALLLLTVGGFLTAGEALPELPGLPLWLALCVGAAGAGVAVVFSSRWLPLATRIAARLPRRLGSFVSRVIGAFAAYGGAHGVLGAALLWSLVFQAHVIVFYWLIGRALGLPLTLAAAFLVVPLALVFMTLPVSINAVGLREGAFVFLLGALGIAPAEALAFAWLEYATFLAWALVGGVVHAARPRAARAPAPSPVPAGPPSVSSG